MKLGRLQYGCLLLCIVGAACQTASTPPPETLEPVPPMPRGYPTDLVCVADYTGKQGSTRTCFSAESSAVGSMAMWRR